MVIIDWIKKVIGIAPVVAVEIKPIVADGAAIVGSLTELLVDLKAGRYGEVIEDVNQSLEDMKVFVAEVEKVVLALQAANK